MPSDGLAEHNNNQRLSVYPWPLVLIALASSLTLIPFFVWGNASGHDFEFHMNSWMEVARQWKQGILYPRWAQFAHYGYGEARFIFYPPASWMLGAVIGLVLPWKMVPGAYIWLVLWLAGCGMFFLARRWFNHKDAVLAAILYTLNPYFLIIVYWRSAFAELLAGAYLPLLLLFVLEASEEATEARRWRSVLYVALVVAAAWLTNLPSAVMVNYSLALLLVVTAILNRSARPMIQGVIAVALGLALAAFYVIPAAYEGKWVNLAEVLSPGVRPVDNFLFTFTKNADHNRFNLLVSIVAASEFVVVGASVVWARARISRKLYWNVSVWGVACCIIMVPFTALLWNHLPELRYVQLPWRWLLCLNAALVLLLVGGWKRRSSRVAVSAVLLLTVFIGWHKVQNPWWDTSADIAELEDGFDSGSGNEGTDEYVPAKVDPYEVSKDAKRVSAVGSAPAHIEILQWDANYKSFVVEVPRPEHIVLRLFNYPAWKVAINGYPAKSGTRQTTGEIVIPLDAGTSAVQVRFTRTWDRTLGVAISLVGMMLVAAWWWIARRQLRREAALL